MEFNSIIDYIARTNLFNFVIFAGIIIFIVKKLKVKVLLENAKKAVYTTIHESEDAKTESETKLSGIEESMKHIGDEIDLILQETEKNSKLVGEKILEDAQKNTLTVKENTVRTIENTKILLKNDLIRRASLASVEVAKAHIIEELSKNKELHDKLIDESLEALKGVETEWQ